MKLVVINYKRSQFLFACQKGHNWMMRNLMGFILKAVLRHISVAY